MSIFDDGSQTKEERKRTILAVVISTLIMGVGFTVQSLIFPPVQAPPAQAQAAPAVESAIPPASTVLTTGSGQAVAPAPAVGTAPGAAPGAAPASAKAQASQSASAPAEAVPLSEARYKIETDLFAAEFTNAGGDLVSLKLKEHKDKTGAVDLVVPGSSGARGLSLAFGGTEALPVSDFMNATWLDADRTTIQFSRTLYANTGSGGVQPFTYKKIFTFRPGEYMFGMAVSLEGANGAVIPINVNGLAYTLSMGPQIGPRFDHLPKNADYRKYILEIGGKKKLETAKTGAVQPIKDKPSWGALAGKYFAFIAVPELPFASFAYLQGSDAEIKQTNTMFLSRPAVGTSSQTDRYYFYFGPRTATELSKYEYADKNAFGLASMKLEDATERSNILGWLESLIKILLNFFYRLIPNYGVAIILVTIVIKAIFFPLTKKGSISTARMQELQPKLQEIQNKYKGNTQRLNQEMAEFYKRENYNPMSGCLPMLIQFPLFIAMYNLFNNHFDLRGASFIPGWIPDLSLPESIINFGSFRLPVLGWNDIRALPIIYLASQLFYGKFTQTPQSGQSASQMKLMLFGMPIMFFFVLYDVPSGLLIYWIVSNVLSIVQQIVINDMLKKHKLNAALAGAASASGGGSGPGSASPAMKSAGRTAVKSSSPAPKPGLGDKVKSWLEEKAAQAETTQNGQGAQNGSTKGGVKPSGKSGKKGS